MIMGRFVYIASFLTVCLLLFSPSLLADRVVSLPDRADSFFDHSGHFIDADFASIDGHSSFLESRTFGSNRDHVNSLVDFDVPHGKAWGWHKHHNDDGDQDNGDTDDDSGHTGSTGSGSATLAVPEPSVLVLLSAALAAFLLNSLRRATV